jgi:hypothetical protein
MMGKIGMMGCRMTTRATDMSQQQEVSLSDKNQIHVAIPCNGIRQ